MQKAFARSGGAVALLLSLAALTTACAPTFEPATGGEGLATPVAPVPATVEPMPLAMVAPTATLAAALMATVVAGLPPTMTPAATEEVGLGGGYTEAGVLQLKPSAGEPERWVAYSQGMRGFGEPLEQHFVAVYEHAGAAWTELARAKLDDPDYLGEGSVSQVPVVPGETWLAVDSGVGAHSGCLDLLRLTGPTLSDTLNYCHDHPTPGDVEDINGDGTGDVVLDTSDDYVFCYACGVREVNYEVRRWDGEKFVTMTLAVPSVASPAITQAVTLAQAGLWRDAWAALDGVPTPTAADPAAVWASALVGLTARGRADQADSGAYPLLDHLFYGDYPAVLDDMRPLTPARLFAADTPLVQGTAAEGWTKELTDKVEAVTTPTLSARPDLAAAYFVRGWARHLADPTSAAARADIARAAELDPHEPLFTTGRDFLAGHKD